MRKILIPTNFTEESLQLVEYAVLNHADTKIDVVLVVGYRLPHTRWGMIHLNPNKQIRCELTDQFIAAKRRLLLEHKDHIVNITFQLYTGTNSFAFQNFLKLHETAYAIIPRGEELKYQNNKWFDTSKLLKKNVKHVIDVPINCTEEISPRKFSLASFFNL